VANKQKAKRRLGRTIEKRGKDIYKANLDKAWINLFNREIYCKKTGKFHTL
jgi:hypothetical protein